MLISILYDYKLYVKLLYDVAMTTSLPNTSYAVLGLLSFGEALSGYELKKQAENLNFFYWSPAQSQIYSELRRLAKEGYVSSKEVKQSGKPDKRLYKATKAGLAELKRWLSESPLEPASIKHPFALKLYFGHMSDKTSLLGFLESYIASTKEALGELAIVQEFTQHTEGHYYQSLLADWGYHHYQAELDFAQKLHKRLSKELA